MTGRVPTELGNLVDLEYGLGLLSNKFDGSIPTQFGRMTQMTDQFYLMGNSFCGDVPDELQALSSGIATYYVTPENNNLGTACCTVLPAVYTCATAPNPTSAPTRKPTPTTSAPTRKPTPNPTGTSYVAVTASFTMDGVGE